MTLVNSSNTVSQSKKKTSKMKLALIENFVSLHIFFVFKLYYICHICYYDC